jgi:NAD(P)-dependent dehydrogenase (short-subunit alcohol dehydrogenase family)
MDTTPRVALVTGAARGLGWGIARAFGLAGFRVCAADVDEAELARAGRDFEADGFEYLALRADAAHLASCEDAVARTVERWGRIDAVVHNGIYMPLLSFDETTADEWRRQIDVGLSGMFHFAHAAWPRMKAQGGGHLIGIASGSSFRGYKQEIAYCAVKHGIEGFVKALSLESSAYGIAVNTMSPGAPIKPTRMTWTEYDRAPAEQRAKWTDPVRLGRAFVWLASQPTARINGHRLDAGPIADALEREGPEFEVTPEKITLYPDDFRAREAWYRAYPD